MPDKPDKRTDEIVKRIIEITKDSAVQETINAHAQLNHEFIKGNQWVYLDSGNQLRAIEKDEGYYKRFRKDRPRETVNIIAPIWQTFKAYLFRTIPRIIARPQSLEDVDDLLAARTATKLMEYFYEALFIREMKDEIVNQVIEYGTAILYPFYNPDTKRLDLITIPPSQIYPDPPGETKWKNLHGICWRRMVSVETTKAMYPELNATETQGENSLDENRDRQAVQLKGNCWNDYWRLPKGKKPGYMVRVIDKELVFNSNTYPKGVKNHLGDDCLPFFPAFDRKLNGELFGHTTIGLSIGRQKSLNKGKSILAHMRSIMPKLKIDKMTKLDPDDVFDDDSTVLEYLGVQGKEPGYIGQPMPSSALFNDLAVIPQEIEHSTGFHEIMLRGIAPGAIQSGAGVERLQSTDELRLLPCLESLRIALINTFDVLYNLCKERYSQDQIKKILGEMGEVDIITFDAVPMSPMTFSIVESSFSPFDQASRQQKAMQLLPSGILNVQDPKTKSKILRWVDADLADAFDVTASDERLARFENREMLNGELTAIHSDDKDDIHIDGHNIIIKDVRFEKLSSKVQTIFIAHQETHRKQGVKKMEAAMKMMQQAQGNVQPPAASAEPQPGTGGV